MKFAVQTPMNVVIQEGQCEPCKGRFAVLIVSDGAEPYPLFCPFCAHRASYKKAHIQQAGDVPS